MNLFCRYLNCVARWGVLALWAGLGHAAEPALPESQAKLLAWAPPLASNQKEVWVGISIELAPSWHTYWKNPGDAGLPLHVQWRLPKGWKAGEMLWPRPEKWITEGLGSYGYEKKVLFLVPLYRPSVDAKGPVSIKAKADWLICQTTCVPQSADLFLTFSFDEALSLLHAPLFQKALSSMPLSNALIEAKTWVKGEHVFVSIKGLPASWVGRSLEWFPEKAGLIAVGKPSTQQWRGNEWQGIFAIGSASTVSADSFALVGLERSFGEASASSSFRVAQVMMKGDPPFSLQAKFSFFDAMASFFTSYTNAFLSWSWFDIENKMGVLLLSAWMGGVLLNVMPCVFPLLAIKVLGLSSCRRPFQEMCFYSLGVLVSLLGLGGAILALRAAGESVGWGFQLQQPWVLMLLIVLFVLITLDLANLLPYKRKGAFAMAAVQWKHPLLNAAWSGVITVLVATPCTAPFMGAAMGAAIVLPWEQALILFAALGLGLVSPLWILSLMPRWFAFLPAAGPWMDRFKVLMAFPMALTVIWLIHVLIKVSALSGLILLLPFVLLGIWLLALCGWLISSWAVWRQYKIMISIAVLLMGLAIGIIGLNIKVFKNAGSWLLGTQATSHQELNWQAWSFEAQYEALKQGRKVFVNYTAQWCLTCQWNETQVLNDAKVLEAFEQNNWVLLKADWTTSDVAITRSLNELKRNGVPTYVILKPNQAPEVLSELLTPSTLLLAISKP